MERDDLHLGEWCVFKIKSRLLIGIVLGFCYTDGKTFKTRQYTKSFAVTKSRTPAVGVLGMWYSWTANGTLAAATTTYSHIGIENYKLTIPAPSYSQNILQIKNEDLNFLNEL